jgi:NADH-quinone oxidoreductase subunit J
VTVQEVAFAFIGLIGSVAAFRLVTSRNVVHAALSLVMTLASVAATYLLLGAEFIGWVQVIIYVGAIVVLVLFALMLTRAPIGREALDNQQRGVAAVVGVIVLGGLIVLIQSAFGGDRIHVNATTVAQVGQSLFRAYVLPFEVVSVLLLAALIGAIVVARKDEPE